MSCHWLPPTYPWYSCVTGLSQFSLPVQVLKLWEAWNEAFWYQGCVGGSQWNDLHHSSPYVAIHTALLPASHSSHCLYKYSHIRKRMMQVVSLATTHISLIPEQAIASFQASHSFSTCTGSESYERLVTWPGYEAARLWYSNFEGLHADTSLQINNIHSNIMSS